MTILVQINTHTDDKAKSGELQQVLQMAVDYYTIDANKFDEIYGKKRWKYEEHIYVRELEAVFRDAPVPSPRTAGPGTP